jgi:hypothetical protein
VSTEKVNNIAGTDRYWPESVTKAAFLMLLLRDTFCQVYRGRCAKLKREIVGREELPIGVKVRASCWSDWKSVLLE